MKRSTGQTIRVGSGDDAYQAFVPAPLPPAPPLKLTAADHDLIERANRSLGKLDGMTSLLPDTSLLHLRLRALRRAAQRRNRTDPVIGLVVEDMGAKF